DLAINGRGFFQLQLPDGSLAYSRDGGFKLDAQGQVVNNAGYPLQPGINVPEGAQSVSIGADGVVSVQFAGEAAPQQVGQLTVADFINVGGLQPIGENLYAETASSGTPQTGAPGQSGLGVLIQG